MYNQVAQTPSLYVGDLAPDVTEQTLHEIFNGVGNVASIRVCRDINSRQSLGYAYVNFHNAVDADRAIQTLNFSNINGKQCRIMWSQRDPALRKSGLGNIFIKNLEPSVDNKTLMDLFSVFGNILSCKVATDDEGKSKGYGYVHFDSPEAAKKAIERYDGQFVLNQQISVTMYQRREDRQKQVEWTNIYLKNIPLEWDEERIRNLFSQFGPISSIKISRDLESNPYESPHRGFGFVNFESHESARHAVDQFNDHPYEVSLGTVLLVSKYKSKQERQREKDKDIATRRLQRFSGVSLFIKNLEDSINEDMLTELFSKYGNVLSTRVMRDGSGYSRRFGFVSFSNVEEARNAISDLNNCSISGKPITVKFAYPNDHGRAHGQAPQLFAGSGMPYPAPSMYGMPMYLQPGQQLPTAPRPYSFMPVMPTRRTPSGSQSRPSMPVRGYPIPPYQMNHFNVASHPHAHPAANQPYPNMTQYQHQQQFNPQTQQQQMQRKNKTTKPIMNQRGPRQGQNQVNMNEVNQQNLILQANEPLKSEHLTSMSEDQRKGVIGERLYPKIAVISPEHAPKITGMLLEMDNAELLHLLESDSLLQLKIQEALHVLKNFNQSQ